MKTSTLSKAGTILVSASLVAGAGVAVASAAEQGDMRRQGRYPSWTAAPANTWRRTHPCKEPSRSPRTS